MKLVNDKDANLQEIEVFENGPAQEAINTAEREQYLELSKPVGRSPAFVVQLKREDGGELALEDYQNFVNIQELLVDDEKDCLGFIHKEAEAAHLTGLVLAPGGLEKLKKVFYALNGDEVEGLDMGDTCYDFEMALAVPEENDEQAVTIVDGNYTVYGSSILALARGTSIEWVEESDGHSEEVGSGDGQVDDNEKKVDEKKSFDDIYVYQLAGNEKKGAVETKKGTRVRRTKLDEVSFDRDDYQWAGKEQLEAIDEVFEKPSDKEITEVEIDMKKNIDVWMDLNNSGKKIENIVLTGNEDVIKHRVEDRRLVVAANYKLLINTIQMVKELADRRGDKVYFANILGDSIVMFIPRDQRYLELYQQVMRGFAERRLPPDVFCRTVDEKSEERETPEKPAAMVDEREETLANLSSVTTAYTGAVNGYTYGDRLLIGQNWNARLVSDMETYHKKTGKKPSEIVRADDPKFRSWRKNYRRSTTGDE